MAYTAGRYVDITSKIIKAFLSVYNELGQGFLEGVYQKAMLVEIARNGLRVEQERPIHVYYRGVCVGDFFADLIVEDKVICELKAVKEIHPEHRAQLLNYLKSSKYEVGLLMNFGGTEPLYERKSYDNANKGSLRWANKSELT